MKMIFPNSISTRSPVALLIIITALTSLTLENSVAQSEARYMRVARIVVDSTRLDDYVKALREQMQSALRLEKGVLAYSAVQDKDNPSKITILETYASIAAYQAHTQTEHFKKYKTTVADMVRQLELTDVVPIAIQSKLNREKKN